MGRRPAGALSASPLVLNSFMVEPRDSGELSLAPCSKVDRVEHDTKQVCRN